MEKSQLLEEYFFLMQEALKSLYVSENLNEWINLIFGCYQDSYEKTISSLNSVIKVYSNLFRKNQLQGL
jgi:aspartate/tyrosine/aromatic aminotransferase